MFLRRYFKFYYGQRERFGVIDQFRWWFTPTQVAFDFGYRRSDFTAIIYYKHFKGKFWIVKEMRE